MKKYIVAYKLDSCSAEEEIEVTAKNKEEAYDIATYEAIPQEAGSVPYSSWVTASITKAGKVSRFNTIEGDRF